MPFFDLLLWTKIDIKSYEGENLKLKIPELTKPWTKFKIKGKWQKNWTLIWDMYVVAEAKMPSKIPEDIRSLLETIKYRL